MAGTELGWSSGPVPTDLLRKEGLWGLTPPLGMGATALASVTWVGETWLGTCEGPSGRK